MVRGKMEPGVGRFAGDGPPPLSPNSGGADGALRRWLDGSWEGGWGARLPNGWCGRRRVVGMGGRGGHATFYGRPVAGARGGPGRARRTVTRRAGDPGV